MLDHFRGRIRQWDVVNEPLDWYRAAWHDSVFFHTLGPAYLEEVFRLAHEADPSAQLVLNEELHRYDDEHAEKFYEIVKDLVRGGAPLHGVGLQSHVLVSATDAASLSAYVGRLAGLGLFVELTELDVRLRLFDSSPDPYAAQGEYFRKLAGACLEHSACRGITVWGISDRFSWLEEFPVFAWLKPNAPLLFDEAMQRKPAYFGLRDAVAMARRRSER